MGFDLLAEYHRLLYQTEEKLVFHNEKQWVNVLRRWHGELTSANSYVDLKQHAVRTARALGGIGSVSEIALIRQDEPFTEVLHGLYATCSQIRNLASIQRRLG